MRGFDPVALEKWRRLTSAGLLVVAAIACFLNYRGMRTVMEPLVAGLLAFVCSLFHVGSWAFIFDAVPRAGHYPAERRGLLVLAGVVVVVAIVATSTWFGWTGMAGPPSQLRHMTTIADEGTSSLSDLTDAHGREQELKDAVTQAAQSFARNAQDERDHGLFTTQKTSGPVYAAVQSVADTYNDAATMLEKDDEVFKRDHAEAEAILSQMRSLHAEAAEHDDRVQDINVRFATLTLRLNALLTELKHSPVPSVLAMVRKSDTIVAMLPARRDQNAESARTSLLKLVKDTKQRIEEIPTGGRALIHVETFKTLNRAEASVQYMSTYPQYAIFAIVVDLVFPLLGLVILAFYRPFENSEVKGADKTRDDDDWHPSSASGVDRARALPAPSPKRSPPSSPTPTNGQPPTRKPGGRDVDALIEAARRQNPPRP